MSGPLHTDEPPAWGARVPGFPDITAYYSNHWSDGRARIEYYGWPQDLIAAGIISEEMVEPSGKRLRDADGDMVSLTRSWRLKEGSSRPERYCIVLRRKPVESIRALPGAAEAIAARERYRAWETTWEADRKRAREGGHVQSKEKRHQLRLVVDNTRRQSP